jgi:hypothetical protein
VIRLNLFSQIQQVYRVLLIIVVILSLNSFINNIGMKKYLLSFLILTMSLLSYPAFSQEGSKAEQDSTLSGLPGDNLDLYAVLDLFQKSKTIEDFEKDLNLEKTGINNLDLDLDGKVDFIKVTTKQKEDDFTFILQVAVTEKETQDVAVIFVSKDKNKKVTMQIVGDVDLYGKDFIVEPKSTTTPATTANPGYTGDDPVVISVPATTTTVVVESAPIVQYVYSPAYVPYYPPYYYGFYPPYFAAFTVMAVGIYRHNNYYHHGGYGYHGNTTVIHNTNNFNNYNNSRNSSNTVNHNKASGNYSGNRGSASTRPSAGTSNRPTTGASTRPSTGASNRPSTGTSPSTRPSTGASTRPSTGASTRPSTGASTRPSTGASPSSRPSAGASPSTRQSAAASPSTRQSGSSNSYNGGGRTGGGSNRSSAGYSGGGGARSSGGYSGGGGRGGGGGGRGGGGRR